MHVYIDVSRYNLRPIADVSRDFEREDFNSGKRRYMYACMHVFMSSCMHVFMCSCVHVCMCSCCSRVYVCMCGSVCCVCVYCDVFVSTNRSCSHSCVRRNLMWVQLPRVCAKPPRQARSLVAFVAVEGKHAPSLIALNDSVALRYHLV